ncbi:MAG TPA: EAL domain-containing protein [Thermoanaerobaculia bacterium]|nr:EAL domain-containing protein [Thermoanaerobaculia bacterium]
MIELSIPHVLREKTGAEVIEIRRAPLRDEPQRISGSRRRFPAAAMPAVAWTTNRELRFSPGPSGAGPSLLPDELEGISLFDCFNTRDPQFPTIRAHFLALEGESVRFEQEWGGRLFRAQTEPLRDDDGRIIGCFAVALDITELKQAAEALYWEKERAQVTLASIGDGVIRTDASGRIDYINSAAERLTGCDAGSSLGAPVGEIFKLVDELTREPLRDPVERCFEADAVVESPGHALLVGCDGRELAVRDSAAPIHGRDGKLAGAVLVFKDVTQLRDLEREMVYLASYDALTGLINRREFEIRLQRAIAVAQAERRQHILLYLDLDEFKVVNDTCGHLAGDEMLKQVASLLRSRVRHSDLLARLGGDEFGVLLEDCPLDHARQIAEEMRCAMGEFRFSWLDQIFDVGVSIGLVSIDSGSGDLGHVMSGADAACYVAKDSGRNRVHEYELDDTLVAVRHGEMQWIHRIHRAFEDQRFRLYYQRIEPLHGASEDEKARGLLCEIFIRMLDSTGELVEPTAFISAAERYHLITSLDRWVIQTAFRALAEAQRKEPERPLHFAINLSGPSISEEAFLTFVIAELMESGVDARRVCFEITETAAISKLDSAMRFIAVLKERGCRFILDDFGSGLSSFAYLRDLPVDFLKIDGEFVRGMVDDPVKRALVESIHQIGHVMGIATIAECVEDDETLLALKEIGVDYAQGHFLARPQPLVND